MTISEFMDKYDVSRRTVYRWIENGEIEAEKIGGKWFVQDMSNYDTRGMTNNDNRTNGNHKIELELRDKIEKQQTEIDYLRSELTQAHETIKEANETIADMQNRHDTIVMSLSNQLADERKKLEDLRDRSIWRRVKTALRFAAS